MNWHWGTASSLYPQPESLVPFTGSSGVAVITSKQKTPHGASPGAQPNGSTMATQGRRGRVHPSRWMKKGGVSSVLSLGWAPPWPRAAWCPALTLSQRGTRRLKTALRNATHDDSFIIFPNSPSSRGPHRDPGPCMESGVVWGSTPDPGSTRGNLPLLLPSSVSQ